MAKWNTADLVRLKSGGPVMTVKDYSEKRPTYVRTVWFEGSKAMRGAFPEATLEAATAEAAH
jgi:uncharacterized protein YodC (DUF2158 family)